MKPGVKGTIRYTTDGLEPTENSDLYSVPVILNQNTTLKAAIFIEKAGKIRKFVRTKSFVRLRPAPSIEKQRKITDGTLQVSLSETSNTGTVYYTTDGTDPSINSSKADGTIKIKGETTIKARTIWIENGNEYQSEIASQKIDVPKLTEDIKVIVDQGIRFEYYEGMWKKLPDFDQLTVIKEGINPAFDVSQKNRKTRYGFRYTGFINIPVDGIYTFHTASDDASSIWLHNDKLVDNDGNHAEREMKNNIALKAGLHPISVLYYQYGGHQAFSVKIEGPDMEKQSVPADMLFHE